MLTLAAGGARRPELISEAEARREAGGDDLDFDSTLFENYSPTEGAPGPEQAPLWEDVEQPEAEVAAALHMELAELRALRTPVPTRPSGMMAVARDQPLLPGELEDESNVTNPVPRVRTDEMKAPITEDDLSQTRPAPRQTPPPMPVVAPPAPAPAPAPVPARAPAPRPMAPRAAPQIGAAFLQRTAPSRLPWILVAMLGMAVLGLVAYIVMA